ncbi:MAG: acetate kinase [Tenericutes bacterium]|nr:acetate kinase [Mycoplasmatota bacterium]
MKIMVINTGSSSLKFSLFNMNQKKLLINGLFERIGNPDVSGYKIKFQDQKIENQAPLNNHIDAVNILLNKLVELKIIEKLEDIDGIGHRIVHGGIDYKESVLITDKVVQDLIDIIDLAPLHNPAHIMGIQAFKKILPNIPMVAVFDTAFHQTIDETNYLYSVPYSWYRDYKIRKYGFHGTSHRYISETIMQELKSSKLKIISCHLGAGGSICAIKDGKSIDTSMGFTPLAGITMATRSGDIDVSFIPYLIKESGKTLEQIIDDLNTKSGLLGISEYSSDSRDIEEGMANGNANCILAQKKLVRSIVNYIASYYVQLDGADVICFAGGIGEKSPITRKNIIDNLACLGIYIDEKKNNIRSEFRKISTEDSKVAVYIIPTDEELMLAKDTLNIINR